MTHSDKLTVRDMAILALMAALMVGTQIAMASLPNIHLVALLIILTTLTFGWRAMYSVVIFVMLEGVVFGFGIWWISYIYAWPVLVIVTMLFKNNTSPLFWAVVAGAHGLCFGALCSLPYLFTGGVHMALSYWINGIPFDLMHCAGNFVLTLVLIKPLRQALGTVNG